MSKHLSNKNYVRTFELCMQSYFLQHSVNKYLDQSDYKAVRLFAIDFSKAFDFVKHNLLSDKLKQLPINPYIVNWYHTFLAARQQRICFNDIICSWKSVNKGTVLFHLLMGFPSVKSSSC